MPSRYRTRCSMSLIIREGQTKTTMRCHLTPVRMTIIKKMKDEGWPRCGEIRTLVHCRCTWTSVQLLQRTIERFLKKLKLELPSVVQQLPSWVGIERRGSRGPQEPCAGSFCSRIIHNSQDTSTTQISADVDGQRDLGSPHTPAYLRSTVQPQEGGHPTFVTTRMGPKGTCCVTSASPRRTGPA